jgi:hypothetical protein
MLGELIDLVSGIAMREHGDKARDISWPRLQIFPFTLSAEWNG